MKRFTLKRGGKPYEKQRHVIERNFCAEWGQAARFVCAGTVKNRKKYLEMMFLYENYSVYITVLCFENNTTV